MKKSHSLASISAAIIMFLSTATSAALIDRGDGLIYDNVLNITWLQNSFLAASNTFGLPTGVSLGTHPSDSSGFNGIIYSIGTMNWPGALHWIDAMNADGGTGYKGFNDWRLPIMSPVNGSSFNTTLSSDATTDMGTAPTTTDGSDGGWRDGSNNPVSEMGHMYYVNLANLGLCDPAVPYCTFQTGWGLNNTSFVDAETGLTVSLDINQSGSGYWFGTELNSSTAWGFGLNVGSQVQASGDKDFTSAYVWAVRPGDVPIPAAVWLFGSGLLGLVGIARRKS